MYNKLNKMINWEFKEDQIKIKVAINPVLVFIL